MFTNNNIEIIQLSREMSEKNFFFTGKKTETGKYIRAQLLKTIFYLLF